MEFQNGKSIFLQIADSLTERILNNEFAPDSKIPSVREMASEVGVNPNTIMRTYSELQSMNIIENKRGIGYYVKTDAKELIRQKKRDEFFNELLPGFLKQAKVLGITNDELKKYL
ncbi:MAG: GntR family transcriptional regulator [Bacteroidota bacterium]